jgi:hypothetical protein
MDEIPTAEPAAHRRAGLPHPRLRRGAGRRRRRHALLRDGELAFAVILWVITFAVGATLMGVSLLIRALAPV